MAWSIAGIDDPFSCWQRPDFDHRLRNPLQAVGHVGAAYPRHGIHFLFSCQGAGTCCALVCLPRRHGGGGRCLCSQVGGLVDVSGVDRRAWGLQGELYVTLNCRVHAHVLALLIIPNLVAWRARSRGLASVFWAEADSLLYDCPCRVPLRLVTCPFEILRIQRCSHDLARVFPLALVVVVHSSGLFLRVHGGAWVVIELSVSVGSVLVHRIVGPLPPSLSTQGPRYLAARRGSCAAYPLRWNSNVKLSLSAAHLPGGSGRT